MTVLHNLFLNIRYIKQKPKLNIESDKFTATARESLQHSVVYKLRNKENVHH